MASKHNLKIDVGATFKQEILWKDAAAAPRAAAALRLDAATLGKLGVVDEVVPEPFGGAHQDPAKASVSLQQALHRHLAELRAMDMDDLL